MSIDFDLRLWDSNKASEHWLSWLEMSPAKRATAEPQEQVMSVLEIMAKDDAPKEWITGRLAMLDLAFGQVGEPLPINNLESYEPFARLLLIAFADCPSENGKLPSPRLMLHPLYYERLLETVSEETINNLITTSILSGEKLTGLRRILDPIIIPEDPSFASTLADALVNFWNHLEPFFRKAVELDAGRGNIVIFETVNGEVGNPHLLQRAAQHEQWLRESSG
ncbi:MAG: hypothetical protein WCT28_01950 [Patescibacteria group bacterium]|jgi:hypothetical protein